MSEGINMGKRQDTINRILSSAKELFYTYGYKKVTMQDIADKANISKVLLTHYFPRKVELLTNINYQSFIRIHNYAKKHAEGDPLLQYMLTTYHLKKSQYSDPGLIRISKETFLDHWNMELTEYTSHDSIYIDILRQFNINISLNDFHPKLIMGLGAQRELAHVYINQIIDMDIEEFLKNSVLIMCTVIEIPAIIRNEYYDKLMKIVRNEPFQVINYLKDEFPENVFD